MHWTSLPAGPPPSPRPDSPTRPTPDGPGCWLPSCWVYCQFYWFEEGELPQVTLAKVLLWAEIMYRLSVGDGLTPADTTVIPDDPPV